MEQQPAERWPARTPAVEHDRVRVVELDAADGGPRKRRWRCLIPALLGLYPGYGLNAPEELRRGFSAVLSAVAAVAVFAWAFRVVDSLPRVQLAAGFLGLLVLMPLARQVVEGAMKRIGPWGKPVMVIGSKGVGGRVAELLAREWALGYEPVEVFDHNSAAGAAPERSAGGRPLAQTAALAQSTRPATSSRWVFGVAKMTVPAPRRRASASFRNVLVIPNLAGITNSAVVSRDLAGTFAVESKHNLLDPWALRTKRVLDLAATAAGGSSSSRCFWASRCWCTWSRARSSTGTSGWAATASCSAARSSGRWCPARRRR